MNTEYTKISEILKNYQIDSSRTDDITLSKKQRKML